APATSSSVIFSWDFSQGTLGWQGGFADYPQGEEDFYELDFGWQPLPANLGAESALFITGNNHSDDLFMYFRHVITGLTPQTTYRVTFNVELASNAPDGSSGIGGSPANSVYLKAGVTQVEPLAQPQSGSNFLELNVDKGNQSQGGKEAVVLGDIAKPDDGTFDYAIIRRAA
ncbi:MAG: PEP-CTERM sorting domain-containing protein, partial [Microcystaceae cyanobacterium]